VTLSIATLIDEIEQIPGYRLYGRVATVLGMLIEVAGLENALSVGGRCNIVTRGGTRVPCEVIGFRNNRALVLPFGAVDGIGLGCKAEVVQAEPVIWPTQAWLGRVINALWPGRLNRDRSIRSKRLLLTRPSSRRSPSSLNLISRKKHVISQSWAADL